MIKCQNLTTEDISEIADFIAESFLAEEGGFALLDMADAKILFNLIIDVCYKTGHLYTTSEKQEGYCVYWTKNERPSSLVQLKLGFNMLKKLPLKALKTLMKMQNDWQPIEKVYKHNDNFVEVFLIAVKREFQGQGYLRQILQEPFDLANKLGTIAVLDTDSEVKKDKYCHVGMKVVKATQQKSGIKMFMLEK